MVGYTDLHPYGADCNSLRHTMLHDIHALWHTVEEHVLYKQKLWIFQ